MRVPLVKIVRKRATHLRKTRINTWTGEKGVEIKAPGARKTAQ